MKSDSNRGRPGTFHVMAAVSIATVCLAAYSNSLHGPFVFDDNSNIVDNLDLRWTSLSWSQLVHMNLERHRASRLVAYVSFALNYFFGEYNVWGYHAVNIGIHLLNGLLVYMLVLATIERVPPRENRQPSRSVSYWIAASAALIFVSHPIQTQAVTYVVQRMTTLCVLFVLAALLLYINARTAKSQRRCWALWTGSFVCWLLALGCKQIAATLPLAILLYEWYFFRDLSVAWVKKNATAGLLALVLSGVVAWAYLGNQPLDRVLVGYAQRDFTPTERLLTQPRVVMFYISELVFPNPSRLNLTHHVIPSQSLVVPITTWLAMAGVVMLLGLAVHLARRNRVVSFGLLWIFLHLAIESSVLPLEMVFEHRLYLPMIGFALVSAWLLYALAGMRTWWPVAVVAAICLLLSLGTYRRNRVWMDAVTLWSDAVSKSPLHARARNNLGLLLQGSERWEEAGAHYREALRIKPHYTGAHINLGIVLQRLGRLEEAVTHFQNALRIDPNHVKAHSAWGATLAKYGRFEEAVTHYQEALRIKPDFAAAHNNLGWLWATCPDDPIRDGQRALLHARRAVELAGENNAGSLDTLAAAYAELGDFEQAVRWQQRAVQKAADPLKDGLRRRLDLYIAGNPFRDAPAESTHGK